MKAYQDRLADQWQQTRALEYKIYEALTNPKDRQSIFDYRPLPNDPTSQEIEEMKKEKARSLVARIEKIKEKHKKKKQSKK